MLAPHETVSAQAALSAAGVGKQPAVREAFAAAGFAVGPSVGNTFSITGPVSLFEKFFRVKLVRTSQGGAQVVRDDGSTTEELPLAVLPAPSREELAVVAFTPFPDFGPTQY